MLAAGLWFARIPGNDDLRTGPAELIVKARHDIARGDGIAAEVRLGEALKAGIPREAIAAYMGEALLVLGRAEEARKWLADGQFDQASAAAGFRALAKLEQQKGNLQAAGAAFDRAIAITPEDAGMWVEIGRLRFAGGEDTLAIDAAKYALQLDPRSVRALEFRGQLVRDSYGLLAAIPWFEAALTHGPDDVSVLTEYAATLGELGRAQEMLTVTRHVLKLQPGNARAFYLQAVLAARSGNYGLARKLLQRAGGRLANVPGAMLLEGITQISAGNYSLAAESLEKLLEAQPGNARAEALLARALFLSGEHKYLVKRLGAAAAQPGASSYLMTVVGRSQEILGRRDLAGPLLDRAAAPRNVAIFPRYGDTPIAELVREWRLGEAEAIIEQLRSTDPGHYDNQELAGDIQLLNGNAEAAVVRYGAAARIRMSESLMLRRFQANLMAGRMREAVELVDGFLASNPTSRQALRLSAWLSIQSGDWQRARRIFEYLAVTGSESDVQLLSDLALMQIYTGDPHAAEVNARHAYRLQRASPVAAQAWGLSLVALGTRPQDAAALLEKARALMGDNPLLTQGRLRLAEIRES
ncbi:MAG: tetratricopeptide repeat protein [Novosphingobium sp.]|nr:tetratricopeptide repeat protein [Novosphingobium sp.]